MLVKGVDKILIRKANAYYCVAVISKVKLVCVLPLLSCAEKQSFCSFVDTET